MLNPLILLALAYTLGLVIGQVLNFPIILTLAGLLLVLAAGLFFWRQKIFLLIVFLLLGAANLQLRQLPPSANDIARLPLGKTYTFIGQVADEPRVFDDKSFFTLKVEQVAGQAASGSLSAVIQDTSLQYGDVIELRGQLSQIQSLANPGLMSLADFLAQKGVVRRLSTGRAPPKVLASGRGNFFTRISIALKNRLIIVPRKTLPEPYATLLSSIVFGTRAAKTPADIKTAYKRAGVAHLLVASGMHLGILIGVCLFLVRSTKLPLWPGVALTSAVNFLYALMTGFGPSILRAAIMAEIVLLGLLFEREKEVYTSLSLAALLILLVDPRYLFEVGFQLSFGATWSLVYVAPVIQEKLKLWLPKAIAVTLSASIAPVLVSIPITLYHFSQASLIGVLTNVLLLPWIGLVVILGFAATVLGAIWLPLAEMINGANLVLLWLAHQLILGLSSLPFAQIFAAPPSLAMVAGYYLGLVGLVEVLRRNRWPRLNKFRFSLLVLIALTLFSWHAAATFALRGLTITVLDVGQGDAILVEAPSGRCLLIDGGERKMGEKVVLPFLRRKGINQLDLVVSTHPHEDHLGGLLPVLASLKVNTVLEPGFNYDSQSYRRFLELIKQNQIKYHLARAGQLIDLGQGVKAEVLHPSYLDQAAEANPNNWSVVLRLCYGRFAMLLTGDNEREGEDRVLALYSPTALAANIIKAGHHGSSTSTSPEFLAAVLPQQAIISCGRHNKFRHPHASTLQKFKQAGIQVFRTDLQGALTIRSDGQSYTIAPQK